MGRKKAVSTDSPTTRMWRTPPLSNTSFIKAEGTHTSSMRFIFFAQPFGMRSVSNIVRPTWYASSLENWGHSLVA